MSLKSILTTGLMATSSVMGHLIGSRETRFGCGAPEPSDAHKAISQKFAAQEAAQRLDGVSIQAAISVPTWVHIVTETQAEADAVTDSIIDSQIAVLNDNYAASGVSFSLAGTTRTVNTQWSQDQGEIDMKTELREGDYSTLNLYFLSYLSGYLGYCYFPTDAPEGSEDFIIDGCSIQYGTWPGGDQTPFDEGKTATHEVGHWLGLYHTFQDGCSGAGDEIDDTPAQASASSGCPTGRDSCPSQTGVDPIHNYMDYSDDACYEEFSTGQNDRISSFWSQYRG